MSQPLVFPTFREQGFQAPQSRTVGAGVEGLEEITDLEHSECLRRMRGGTLGSIHSWELATVVDGFGARMTVFLNGRPLRCLYCHNPNTFPIKDDIFVSDTELSSCIACHRHIFRIIQDGTTLSGGEILMQLQLAKRIFMGTKKMDVHACIDISGSLGANRDDEMLDVIGLMLLDIKSGSEEIYKRTTGCSLVLATEFSDRTMVRGGATRIQTRFVLVPDLIDDPESVRQVGEIASRWRDVIDRIKVLPFHQLDKDKWRSFGLEYQLEDTKASILEATEEVHNCFHSLSFLIH